jgi:hypothetical protein
MNDLDLFANAGSGIARRGQTVFVDFDGGRVAVVIVDSQPYPILNLACRDLGLDWKSQYAKVKVDPAICMVESTTQLPGDDQSRTVMTTDLDGFVLWLAKINANKVSAEARDLVITWQRKAARAIRDRFFSTTSTEMATARPNLPVDYETALEHLLASVRENKVLAARNAQLEDAAEGYRHFIEADGTVKWRNACEYLGVAPNLFGKYLRGEKVLFEGGERHNRPYAEFAHWFSFPAYETNDPEKRAELERMPEHRRHDRRVTKAGMDGLRRRLKRHVLGCGDCTMCHSVRLAKPKVYAEWRPNLPARGEAS